MEERKKADGFILVSCRVSGQGVRLGSRDIERLQSGLELEATSRLHP